GRRGFAAAALVELHHAEFRGVEKAPAGLGERAPRPAVDDDDRHVRYFTRGLPVDRGAALPREVAVRAPRLNPKERVVEALHGQWRHWIVLPISRQVTRQGRSCNFAFATAPRTTWDGSTGASLIRY